MAQPDKELGQTAPHSVSDRATTPRGRHGLGRLQIGLAAPPQEVSWVRGSEGVRTDRDTHPSCRGPGPGVPGTEAEKPQLPGLLPLVPSFHQRKGWPLKPAHRQSRAGLPTPQEPHQADPCPSRVWETLTSFMTDPVPTPSPHQALAELESRAMNDTASPALPGDTAPPSPVPFRGWAQR